MTKTQAIKKAIWLCCFSHETGFCVMNSVIIKADNKKAIELFRNSKFHVCMKHINIQYHFVCKTVKWHLINLKYIFMINQVTDSLIKSLSVSQVCNETDAQLIIFKYKKNTMKRKEKLHTKARR